MRTSEKGVIFSIDALLAAILLSIFAASIAFLASRSAEDSLGRLLLKNQASDLLSSMDKSGMFERMDENITNQTMQAALQQGTGYLLKIDYYNYSSGNFSLAQSFYLEGGSASAAGGTVSSQRSFAVPQQNRQPLYGMAYLSLWTD